MKILVLGAVVAVSATLACAATAAPPYRLTLPGPTGHSPVGTIALRLVDRSRVDRFAPKPRVRELMVHLWYPAVGGGTARTPYFSPAVAALHARELGIPASVLSSIAIPARTGARAESGRHPVVLFSPGYGAESAFYTELLEDLASHGFVALAIDHTYEESVVFPGGRFVPARLSVVPDGGGGTMSTRIADVRFVLGRLAALDRRGALAGRLDLSRIAMVGHSMGGATAALIMGTDRRVAAGVDLDGGIPRAAKGLDRPFMIARAKGHTFALLQAVDFRKNQRGPLVTATFSDVQHSGFTDLIELVPQLAPHVPGIRKVVPVGKADPGREVAAQRAVVRAFLETYLLGRPSPLLSRHSPLSGVELVVRPAR